MKWEIFVDERISQISHFSSQSQILYFLKKYMFKYFCFSRVFESLSEQNLNKANFIS